MKNQKIHNPYILNENYFLTGLLMICSIVFVNAQAFITTWDTSYPGLGTNGSSIEIPASPTSNYDVDWDNDGIFDEFGVIGPITHDFGSSGTFTIRIQGNLQYLKFDNGGSRLKLISIDQWGSISWTLMEYAYFGCENMNILATDSPNLSNVYSMQYIFKDCFILNADLNTWDVSNVEWFNNAFQNASLFNGNISSWNVSSATKLYYMFTNASAFNQDIGSWIVSSVTSMERMFEGCSDFNQNINAWNVSNVTKMRHMFNGASSFNQDLDMWDVSQVDAFSYMFANANVFNGNIDNWQVYSSNALDGMFQHALAFNRDISSWYVNNCSNNSAMFDGALSFNQDISGWQWSSATSFTNMFQGAIAFNQDISGWDMANISGFANMFKNATSFNQDIGNWDVSSSTIMLNMFNGASSFNQDLSDWNVSNVLDFYGMFSNATSFDQNLGDWDMSNITNTYGGLGLFLNDSGLCVANYDSTLIGWASQSVQNNITVGVYELNYCLGEDARSTLENNHNWAFLVDSKDCSDYNFVTTWKTDNPGVSTSTQITIPTFVGETYNYDIDWESDGIIDDIGVTGDITHDYGTEGTYTISISGTFPRIYFNDGGDKEKILSVEKWGVIKWTSMANAFYGASNLVVNTVDKPDLSIVNDMSYMFRNATNLTGDFNGWNVCNVSNMEGLFSFTNYNGDLSLWDVSQVTNTSNMFRNNIVFDGDLSLWSMGMVLDMSHMFHGATGFIGTSIANWDVSTVTNMFRTFRNASSFNVSLENWMLGPVTDMNGMLNNTNLSIDNYDNTLIAWSALGVNGIALGAQNLDYCNGQTARANLINSNGWSFVGDNLDCSLACGNIIWNGSVNNQWNIPLNWDKNRLPMPCDTVVVGASGTVNIIGPEAKCNKLLSNGLINIQGTLRIEN